MHTIVIILYTHTHTYIYIYIYIIMCIMGTTRSTYSYENLDALSTEGNAQADNQTSTRQLIDAQPTRIATR